MKKSVVLICLIAAILLCACTGGAPAPTPSVPYTDALGREVDLPIAPKRVAALLGSFADVWVLAGGEICATAEDAWDDFGLDLPGAVNLGGAHSPGVEALLASEPDLVLASAATASNVELASVLEAAQIPVVYFEVSCVREYLEMLDVCTDLTGRKDLYEKHGTSVLQEIEAILADYRAAECSEEEKKVLLLRASAGSVKAKGSRGTIIGEMLSDFDCINLADSDESLLEELSVESVLRNPPHRIFVVTMGGDGKQAMENLQRMLQEQSTWGSLCAVREGRVHVMDRSLFNLKPNAKWATSYETLSQILLGE